MSGPAGDELTDDQVADIERAADEATLALDELRAREPAVGAVVRDPGLLAESQAAVHLVRDAFERAGVDRLRADRAATVWLIERRGPRYCLAAADEGPWREPGAPPAGLGGP